MKHLFNIKTALIVTLLVGTSSVAVAQSRTPSQLEFFRIMKSYEQSYAQDLSHVVVQYNRFQKGGAVWAMRLEKTDRCVVAVNPGIYGTGKVESTLEGAPSDLAAKQFLVAHEVSHCLFTPTMAKANLALAQIHIEREDQAQEAMADLSALAFLKMQGTSDQTTLAWVAGERKGHFLSPRYNIGQYLTEENVARITNLLLNNRSRLAYYPEKRKENLAGIPAVSSN